SWTAAGIRFRRLPADYPGRVEHGGANVRLTLSPLRHLRLNFGHENLLIPAPSGRASFDSAGAATELDGFHLTAGGTSSHGGQFVVRSEMFSVSRAFFRRVNTYGAIVQSRGGLQSGNRVWLARSEEKLSPHLTIDQTLTRSNRSLSFSGGAQFLSNRLAIGI